MRYHLIHMGVIEQRLRDTTYSAIATSAGVDRSHVTRIMAGERTPSLPVARLIARHLDVTLDQLAEYLDSLEPVAA